LIFEELASQVKTDLGLFFVAFAIYQECHSDLFISHKHWNISFSDSTFVLVLWYFD